jgi:hypothetical protein
MTFECEDRSDTADQPSSRHRMPTHGTRKLDERYALRAGGAPGFLLVRFRWSATICGQGQGRTADLPLFRSTALSAMRTCENGRH